MEALLEGHARLQGKRQNTNMHFTTALLDHIPLTLLLFTTLFPFPRRDPQIPKELTLAKETKHALFYVRSTREDTTDMVETLSAYFERHYPRITQMLRFAPPQKTTVFIYTDRAQFREAIGRDTEGTYDASDQIIKVYTPADLSRPDVRQEYTFQIVHEFVHAVIQQMNPIIARIKWLDEGTAYFAAGQLEEEIRSQKRFQAPIPRLDQLERSDLYFEQAGGEAYYFSGLIVRFVYEKFGEDAFSRLLRDPLAAEAILGLPLPGLYEAWKEYAAALHQAAR